MSHDVNSNFLHVWNKMKGFKKEFHEIFYTSESAYMTLAELHCPRVYQTLVKVFK